MQGYADYLMLVTLPPNVKNELWQYKRAAAKLIGPFEGLNDAGQLIITHQQRCKPFMVQPAVVRLQQKFKTMAPVELQINGFGYCSNGPYAINIYAVVQPPENNPSWFKLLHQEIGVKPKNFQPRILIAANIPLHSFKRLWPYFEDSQYLEKFKAQSLTILQRETYVRQGEWALFKELFFGERVMPF